MKKMLILVAALMSGQCGQNDFDHSGLGMKRGTPPRTPENQGVERRRIQQRGANARTPGQENQDQENTRRRNLPPTPGAPRREERNGAGAYVLPQYTLPYIPVLNTHYDQTDHLLLQVPTMLESPQHDQTDYLLLNDQIDYPLPAGQFPLQVQIIPESPQPSENGIESMGSYQPSEIGGAESSQPSETESENVINSNTQIVESEPEE